MKILLLLRFQSISNSLPSLRIRALQSNMNLLLQKILKLEVGSDLYLLTPSLRIKFDLTNNIKIEPVIFEGFML